MFPTIARPRKRNDKASASGAVIPTLVKKNVKAAWLVPMPAIEIGRIITKTMTGMNAKYQARPTVRPSDIPRHHACRMRST